jgi:hypothetical protein
VLKLERLHKEQVTNDSRTDIRDTFGIVHDHTQHNKNVAVQIAGVVEDSEGRSILIEYQPRFIGAHALPAASLKRTVFAANLELEEEEADLELGSPSLPPPGPAEIPPGPAEIPPLLEEPRRNYWPRTTAQPHTVADDGVWTHSKVRAFGTLTNSAHVPVCNDPVSSAYLAQPTTPQDSIEQIKNVTDCLKQSAIALQVQFPKGSTMFKYFTTVYLPHFNTLSVRTRPELYQALEIFADLTVLALATKQVDAIASLNETGVPWTKDKAAAYIVLAKLFLTDDPKIFTDSLVQEMTSEKVLTYTNLKALVDRICKIAMCAPAATTTQSELLDGVARTLANLQTLLETNACKIYVPMNLGKSVTKKAKKGGK